MLGYPTELRPFKKKCGTETNPVDPDQFNKDMLKKVNSTIKHLAKQIQKTDIGFKSAIDVQGKSRFINEEFLLVHFRHNLFTQKQRFK